MAFPPRSEAENGVNPPPNLPNGVLAPDTMTVFLMLKASSLLFNLFCYRLLCLIERSLNLFIKKRGISHTPLFYSFKLFSLSYDRLFYHRKIRRVLIFAQHPLC